MANFVNSGGNGGQDPLSLFQVMPKYEWKRLRNKYLELQRKNVAHSKMKLRQYYDKAEEQAEKVVSEPEPPASGPSKLNFVPGVIVKIKVNEAIGKVL